MKKLTFILAAMLTIFSISAKESKQDSLISSKPTKVEIKLELLNRYPYAYTNDKGDIEGIEIEILHSFSKWLKKNKNIQLEYVLNQHESFSEFYETVKSSKSNTLGAGTVTIKKERASELNFSPAYLKNESVLISSGKANYLSDMQMFESNFKGYTAIAAENSVHHKHLLKLKELHYPELQIKTIKDQEELFKLIAEKDSKYLGYVDLISFWKFRTTDKEIPIKIHRIADVSEEHFGFIFPKSNTELKDYFDEFFEYGFGFTETKEYHKILAKYLGEEVVKSVEINYSSL